MALIEITAVTRASLLSSKFSINIFMHAYHTNSAKNSSLIESAVQNHDCRCTVQKNVFLAVQNFLKKMNILTIVLKVRVRVTIISNIRVRVRVRFRDIFIFRFWCF